jgi:ribonuclease HII
MHVRWILPVDAARARPDTARAPVPRGRRPLVHGGVELRCTSAFEEQARRAGYARVAGLDEVGRGALCGPVTACAVVLAEDFDCAGLDDSKRLTRRQRERLAERVLAGALAVGLGSADAAEIDRINILRATHLAMRRALEALALPPDFVLIDGREVPGLGLPQRAIVKGDALSVSIAAASIVAKVTRDAQMRAADAEHPGYGLARNMGYGSAAHRAALSRMGPTRLHRRSFQGTRQAALF